MKRPMCNFLVEQRTKDSMFNATNLLKQWNKFVEDNKEDAHKFGYVKKELKDYLGNKTTKELVKAIANEENLHRQNFPYVLRKIIQI